MLTYSLLVIILAIHGNCDECPYGKYGLACDRKCNPNCALFRAQSVHCHKLTGKCSEGCKTGWHGDQCNHQCSKNCLNNVCNVQNGACIKCKVNYSGRYCETIKEKDPPKNASTPLVAILVPVFAILIIIIIITVTVLCIRHRKCNRASGDPNEREALSTSQVVPTPAQTYTQADSDLFDASSMGNLSAVNRILAAGSADVNCRLWRGMTPVMVAAQFGHREVVELLVSKGADVSLVADVGDHTLHLACMAGNVEMVKFIISQNMVDINSRGGWGRTPVMKAALFGHSEVVNFLLNQGADVSLVAGDGQSILHLACEGGDMETVKFVLSHKMANINATNNEGKTATNVASVGEYRQVEKLLLSIGGH